MKLPSGLRWLRIELTTPANLGSGEGRADVDRPTVKDPQLHLPYIPHSVLKGVVAGRLGDVHDEDASESARREARYGSPDRADSLGQPGPVVFGDADLLGFPVPLGGGGTATVFPAPVVLRVLTSDPATAEEDADTAELLHLVERSAAPGSARPAVGDAAAAEIGAARTCTWLDDDRVRRLWPSLREHLALLAGVPPDAPGPWVVASARAAAHLWREAAEERTLTALDAFTRTVAHGSLRTLELCPPGTLFLSRVSLLSDRLDVELPEALQLGAREADGFGFCRLSLVGGEERADAPERRELASAPADRPPSPALVMSSMHGELLSVRDDPPGFRAALRAVITRFGSRAHFAGLPAAVGFSLAKAKPAASEAGPEPRAHRWLLQALLDPEPTLLDWARTPETLDTLEPRREEIFERWLWLRRFSEVLLTPTPTDDPPPDTGHPPEEEAADG